MVERVGARARVRSPHHRQSGLSTILMYLFIFLLFIFLVLCSRTIVYQLVYYVFNTDFSS